jgi:hypothetical protein
MQMTQSVTINRLGSLALMKSFFMWTMILTVCLLVVGFPLVVLMVTAAALMSVALQSVLPVSAVLLVAGGVVGVNILAVVISAAVLTLKGVHPHQVRWLHWLNGADKPQATSVYAACPLTCELDSAN